MRCKKCYRECPPAKFVPEFGMVITPTYCNERHGGLYQTARDLRAQIEIDASKLAASQRGFGIPATVQPNGQAAPHGQGLSQFNNETEEQRKARIKNEQERKNRAAKSRAEREEEQKEWLDKLPNRGESNMSGTGTSKKAKKRQKMARKLRQRR